MKNALLSLLCTISLLAFGQEPVQTGERSIITKDQINTYKLSADRWLVRFESGISENRKDQLLQTTGMVGAIEHLPSPEVSLIRVQSQNSEKQILNTLQALPQVLYAARGMVFGDGTNEFPLDRVFVQLKDGRQRGYLSQKAAQFGYEEAGESFMPDLMELVFHKNSTLDPVAFSNMLQGEGVVDWSEPDMLKLLKKMSTNDNLINYQWSLNNTGSSIQYNGTPGEDMSVFNAWNGTTGSPSIKVAILDEGVDLDHPDLLANMLPGFDGHGITAGDAINDDAHGTACAGIVAAVANNNIGTAGVAYGSKIIPVRIAYSSGSSWVTSNSIIGNSITWSWQTAGADILSNSWGGGGSSSLIDSPISNAVTSGRNGKGAPVLFAAGNDNSAVSYPATLSDVISVAAMSMCGERKNPSSCDGETWWGSNYGTGLDVAAPGVKIAASDIAGSAGYSTGDYTGSFNGTSSACPNAAGVMALILSADPSLTESNARDILESTCDKAGGYTYTSGNPNGTWSNELGYGRVNAQAAVQSALASTACPFNSQIGVSGVTSTTATIFMLTANTATRNYLIEYGPRGFLAGNGTFISKTATGNDTTVISGLSPITAYSFKYYRVCGTDTSLAKNGPDFTTACGANSCTYTINMTDSYGDGWNGAVIGIYQSGILISTFGNGFTSGSSSSASVTLCDGSAADLIAESAGSYPTEVGFTILDPSGNQVFSRSSGSSFATGNNFGSFAVSCASNPCVAPTNLSILSTTSSDATIYWNGGSATGWNVEYGAAGFSLGSGTGAQASNDTTTLTGLNASTSYDVYVQADCGSSWTGPLNFSTASSCLVSTFPYTEGFESGSPNLSCWTNIQEVGAADWTYAAGSSGGSISGAYSGSANARFVSLSPSGGGTPVTKLVSPPLDLSNMTAPRVSFFYGQEQWYGDQNELKVYYRKSANDPWVQLAHYTGDVGSWTQVVLNLPSHTSTYQIAFEGINNWGRANVLDEVTIEESPTCPAPLNLVASNVTQSSVDLSWDGGTASGWKVHYGLQGDPLGSGTTMTVASASATISGLNPYTAYDFYVRASCGSSWTGPITATTLCAPDSLPYSTDFTTAAVGAATDFGNCWTAQTSNGYEWHGEDATGSNENSVNTGPFYDNTSFGQAGGVYLYAEASSPAVAGDKAYLMSPEIDLAQSSHPKMTFHYHMYGVNTGTLEVEISDNGGSGWQSLYSISGEQQTSGTSAWNSVSLDLTGFTGVVQVRFVATRGADYEGDICLDDISIQNDPPSCAAPINLNVLNTTSNSALLTWTDLNSAQVFKVEYGQSGFTRGSGTTVTASNDTFDLLGLNGSTDYEFYVQSECSWGPSAWSGPLSFKTLSGGGPSFQRFCSVIDSVAEINFKQGVYHAYFDSLRIGDKYRIRWAPVLSQSQSSITIDSTVIRSKVFNNRSQPYMNINITPWYNRSVLVWLESDTLDGQGEVWANPQACTLDRNGQVFQLLNKGGGGVILGSVIDGNIVELPVGCKAQTLSMVVQKTASCAEDSVLLRAGYAGGTGSPSYLWSNGATTKRTFADQGETLSITITDAAGCSITDSITAPTVDTTAVPDNWTLTKNNGTTFTGSFTAPALPSGSTLIGYRMAYRLRNTQTWTNTTLSQNTSITHDFTGSGLPGGNYEFVAFTRYRDASLNAVNSNFTCRLVKGYNGSGNKSGNAGSHGSDADAYAIYPNPSNDLLHVSAGGGSLIRLLDVRGRLIAQEEVHQSEVQFEIGHLAQGVYMVQVISGTHVYTEEVIKN